MENLFWLIRRDCYRPWASDLVYGTATLLKGRKRSVENVLWEHARALRALNPLSTKFVCLSDLFRNVFEYFECLSMDHLAPACLQYVRCVLSCTAFRLLLNCDNGATGTTIFEPLNDLFWRWRCYLWAWLACRVLTQLRCWDALQGAGI